MGEVIEPNFLTSLDIPVERVLRKATEADLQSVVVIGWDKEGETYFASSKSSGPEVLWLMKLVEKLLLEIGSGEIAQ